MKRLSLAQTNRPLDTLLYWRDKGMLMLDAPYQRGDVWGETRQRNLIKSLLQGIPIASIIVNDRSKSGTWPKDQMWSMAVIDGKQRLTAVLKFMDSGFSIPVDWILDLEDFPWLCPVILFGELPLRYQRRFQNIPMAVSEGSLATLEEEIEVFELVNYGGVPQGMSDI